MPVITVRRALNLVLARPMKVEIDGQIVGRLERGASQSFDVAPGPYVVRVHLDWRSSLPIHVDLDDDETITLEAAVGERSSTFRASFLRPKAALDLRLV